MDFCWWGGGGNNLDYGVGQPNVSILQGNSWITLGEEGTHLGSSGRVGGKRVQVQIPTNLALLLKMNTLK